MSGRILIIDDEKDMLTLLKRIISEDTKHEPVAESDPVKALELFRESDFDLVIADLKMPKMDGLKLLEEVKKIRPETSVIILTAFATVETAVAGIQKGAYDYITKPFQRERLLLTIEKVMEWQAMLKENLALKQALGEKADLSPLIGGTPAMREIFERIKQVAPTNATVLITGASGTGKELVAQAIHRNSLRSAQKFVTINSTAIPEQVMESELFGHVKGAFTGAWKNKTGLVEEADGGTLFLDEIGDLSLQMQTKLLRLLQEGEYKPVGSEITRRADLRFIAATNHNLKQSIREKLFREDLYYRLNVIRFKLPALKDRVEDIPMLSYHFLKKYAGLYHKDIQIISPRALQALAAHEFPGNVRELENIIERAVIFCNMDTLRRAHLFLDREQDLVVSEAEQDLYGLPFREAKNKLIELFHSRYIQSLLTQSGGNISRAAEMAGIQRQYLHRLMKEAGIDSETFRKPNN